MRLMRTTHLIVMLAALGALSACGGTKDRSCDDVRRYQLANAGKRIETPEDLDDLSEQKEVPLPEASPRPPREAGSPCLDLPPRVLNVGED